MSRVDRSHPPHSDDFAASAEAFSARGVLVRLIDPAFGLLIWAGHFVAIYSLAALACQLGWVASPARATEARLIGAAFTLAAMAIVIVHAVLTWQRERPSPDHHFLMWITIGHDAIAALAMGWMLFPILLLPVCR